MKSSEIVMLWFCIKLRSVFILLKKCVIHQTTKAVLVRTAEVPPKVKPESMEGEYGLSLMIGNRSVPVKLWPFYYYD